MAAPVPLAAGDDALVAFRVVLRSLAETIDRTRPLVVEGRDPEDLHDLRVALRRTRSVLGDGRRILPKRVRRDHRALFKWLGEVTGPARDLDVFVDALAAEEDPARAGLRAALEGRRRAAHDRVDEVLTGDAATAGLERWRRWLATADVPGGGEAIGPIVARRLRKAQRVVLEAGRAIDADTPGEQLHDLRKDAKRLRYELECFGGLFEPDALRRFVGQLKSLQDSLGTFQDVEVQLGYLHLIEPDLEVDDRPALTELRRALREQGQAARAELTVRFAVYDSDASAAAFDELRRSLRPSGRGPASARPGGRA